MNGVVIGSLDLRRAKSIRREMEVAAWHETGWFEPQTVPLILVKDSLIARDLKGVVTSSYTGSMFGGVAIGEGGVDETVGQPMVKSLQFYDYTIADMLDPLDTARDYLMTLNEKGRELLAQYLPPLPGETPGEFASRRIGRTAGEVMVEEVTLHRLAPHPHEGEPSSKERITADFVDGKLYLFSTRWPDAPATGEPRAKPVVMFHECHPYEFASRIVANADTVLATRASWRDKANDEFVTLGDVLPVKPRDSDIAYGALSGPLTVSGETYVRYAELRRADASLSLLPTVVADLLDAEGNVVDVKSAFDEKVANKVKADVISLGSALLGTLNLGHSVLPHPMSSEKYESLLQERRELFEANLPTHAILRIDTTSAAFEDVGRNVEMARILGEVADRVKGGGESFAVADMNGNKVARFELATAVPDESPSSAAPDGRVRLQVDLAGLPMGRLADNLWPVLKQAQEKALAAEGSFTLTNADGVIVGAVGINDLPSRERSAEVGAEL